MSRFAPDSSILTVIKIHDRLNLFRSVVVGRVRAERDKMLRRWNCPANRIASIQDQTDRERATELARHYALLLKNRNDSKQGGEARRLMQQAGVLQKDEYTIEDVDKIQQILSPHIRLHVLSIDTNTKKVTPHWAGDLNADMNIVLVWDGRTFYIPNSINVLMRRYYCFKCCKDSHHKHSHRCSFTCTKCGSTECHPGGARICCEGCNVEFYSQPCYDRHLQGNRQRTGNRCEVVKVCPDCHTMYNVRNLGGLDHDCKKKKWCKKCQQQVTYIPMKNTNVNHPCYWNLPNIKQRLAAMSKQDLYAYLFYDMECIQNIINAGELHFTPQHVPCCIVVRKICYKCVDRGIDDPCDNCQEREIIFTYNNSRDVLAAFAHYLIDPRHNNRIVLAHCGGRYDHFILLQQLYKMKIFPEVIMRGQNILHAKITTPTCQLQLKDTYALIPMKLADMKKAFNLDVNDKGTWPYLFTTTENYGLRMNGLPDIKYYNIGAMMPQEREKLIKWHASHGPDYVFKFDEELVEYCRTDTKILAMATITYQKAVVFATSWNPIFNSITLASFTNHLLRHDHLQGKKIAHIPEHGLSNQRQQSEGAIKYLEWIMFTEGIHIEHNFNGGEKKFGSYSVDGWCEEMQTIYEYHGCYWHGHDQCYDPNQRNRSNNKLFGELYNRTMTRHEELFEMHPRIVVVWECEVKKMLEKDADMQDFFASCLVGGRLRPRTALQGGRTEAFIPVLEADEDHEIVYLDFNSLYPSVMATAELPVGFPRVLTKVFTQDELQRFPFKGIGLISVLPPRYLQYPLLGVKMRKSLLFPLCRVCALLNNRTKCKHNDMERTLTCAWTHREIHKAQSLGYRILKIFEVWQFDEWDSTLFSSYINTFFKMKLEASGWPDWVETEEDKDRYVDKCLSEMGIELDPTKIEFNAALRTVMKLLLNSSWGKFAQKADLPKVRFMTHDELIDLQWSDVETIQSHYHVGDDMFLVKSVKIDEEIHSPAFGNLPIAIFILSEARLRVYELLELSKGQAGYCDTDSVLAKIRRGHNPFAHLIGEGLGKLSSEVPKGFEIKKVIIKGPKQYAIRMENAQGEEKIMIKIRGVTLDHDALQKIPFERLLNLEEGEEIVTRRLQLKRHLPTATIKTVEQEKRYKKVNNKNVPRGSSLYPFGHYELVGSESSSEEDYEF